MTGRQRGDRLKLDDKDRNDSPMTTRDGEMGVTGRTGHRGESRMTGGWTGRKMNHRQTDGPSSRGARSASPRLSCPRRRASPWKPPCAGHARPAWPLLRGASACGVCEARGQGSPTPNTGGRGRGRHAAGGERRPVPRRPMPPPRPRATPGPPAAAASRTAPVCRTRWRPRHARSPSEEPPTCLADAPADPVISAWRCPERRPASRRPAHTRLGS